MTTKRIVLFSDVHGNITGIEEVMTMNGKLLINCASVGQRKKDSLSNYTIIEYDEKKIAVIQRQVPYDKGEEDRLIQERGMIRRL